MEGKKFKTAAKPIDRIVLHPETRERLNQWMEDLENRFKGLRISRTDLANHLLLSRSETLSSEEGEAIRIRYFDEVSFAAWVLKEAKAAKARGETMSITDLYEGMTRLAKPRRPKKVAAPRSNLENTQPEPSEPESEKL